MEAGTIAPADFDLLARWGQGGILQWRPGLLPRLTIYGLDGGNQIVYLQWRPGLLPRLTVNGRDSRLSRYPCNGGRDYCPG